jgi:Winged helix DNA-binding domain
MHTEPVAPVTPAAPSAPTAQRLAAQMLAGPPARTVVEVVHRLLSVQGQDPRGVRLAIRPRASGLTSADVDRALNDREVLITWLNRGTLHLVRAEDYWWLHMITTRLSGTPAARRLAQEGVPPADADRAVSAIDRALAASGPLTRDQLRDRVDAAGVRTAGQALVHILFLASVRGLVVRGPMVGGQHAFVRTRDWLGPPPAPLDPDMALGELATRYLAGHGPADDADLAKWSGITLGEARRGLSTIASRLRQRPDGLVELKSRRSRALPGEQPGGRATAGTTGPARAPAAPPRLLGAFDPVLLGWVSREPILGGHQGIVTMNGVFRPFALVRGRAMGTWTLQRRAVQLAPFGEMPPADLRALECDAEDVVRFLFPPTATTPAPAPGRSRRSTGSPR